MSITPYLGDFDANPETKRVLGVALEMTRVSLGLADDFADGIITKRIVERVPISCVKARSRNYAGICTETNKQKTPRLPRPTGRLVRHRSPCGAARPPHPSLVETVTRKSAVQKIMGYSKSNL